MSLKTSLYVSLTPADDAALIARWKKPSNGSRLCAMISSVQLDRTRTHTARCLLRLDAGLDERREERRGRQRGGDDGDETGAGGIGGGRGGWSDDGRDHLEEMRADEGRDRADEDAEGAEDRGGDGGDGALGREQEGEDATGVRDDARTERGPVPGVSQAL